MSLTSCCTHANAERRSKAPRRFGLVALVALGLAAVVGLAGCGGGGGYSHYSPAPVGTFALGNDPFSFETIEAVDLSMIFGPVDHYDVLIYPGDLHDFDLFDGSYDVDVFWSDGRVDHLNIDVYDALTTTVVLQN